MTHTRRISAGLMTVGTVAGILALSSVVAGGNSLPKAPQPKDSGTGIALKAPTLPGVAPLPGPVAPSATPSSTMGLGVSLQTPFLRRKAFKQEVVRQRAASVTALPHRRRLPWGLRRRKVPLESPTECMPCSTAVNRPARQLTQVALG